MSEPFLGEVKIMSFGFAPKGWAMCNGQLLPINQNQALFALLGTYYGGDGRVNFALPNLQTRSVLHMGGGFTIGSLGGEQAHTLTLSEMAGHNHLANASTSAPAAGAPLGNVWCQNPTNTYSDQSPNAGMAGTAVSFTGGSQPHNNMSPYLALNFCIALQGIFPSQN